MKLSDAISRAYDLLKARKEDARAGDHAAARAKLEEAEQLLNAMLGRKLDNYMLLFLIAACAVERGHNGLAISLLARVIEQKADFYEAYNNLGAALKAENHDGLARAAWAKALTLRDDDPDLLSNLGTLHIHNGTPEVAERLLKEAIALAPEHADAQFNLSFALLEQGKWRQGFRQYDEWGTKSGNRPERNYWRMGTSRPGTRTPKWNGERAKHVVVYGEQGVGDEVMFASCIPDALRDCRAVVFDCHPRLATVFERSFGIPCFGTRKRDEIEWVETLPHAIDAQCAVSTLARLYRRRTKDFPKTPYLSARPELVEKWRSRLSPGLNVGISWRGGNMKTRMDLRSIPLPALRPILDQARDGAIRFYSLQYHQDAAEEVGEVTGADGMPLVSHWYDANGWTCDGRGRPVEKGSLEDQFALIAALDLVISICASAVHFAGALGKECWCLVPSRPAWRYGLKGPMPWYGTVRLFRQTDTESWHPVIETVAEELTRRATRRSVPERPAIGHAGGSERRTAC